MKPFTFPPSDSDYFLAPDTTIRKPIPEGDFIHIQAISTTRVWIRFGDSSVDADDADGSIVVHPNTTSIFRRPSDPAITHISFLTFDNSEVVLFGTF